MKKDDFLNLKYHFLRYSYKIASFKKCHIPNFFHSRCSNFKLKTEIHLSPIHNNLKLKLAGDKTARSKNIFKISEFLRFLRLFQIFPLFREEKKSICHLTVRIFVRLHEYKYLNIKHNGSAKFLGGSYANLLLCEKLTLAAYQFCVKS